MRGRALTEETTYTYDEQGRLLSARTVKDPVWSPTDRALALANDLYKRSLCSDCGHPRSRAWHPDMDGWFEGHSVECFGCGAIHKAVREAQETKGSDRRALKHYALDTRPPGNPLHPSTP